MDRINMNAFREIKKKRQQEREGVIANTSKVGGLPVTTSTNNNKSKSVNPVVSNKNSTIVKKSNNNNPYTNTSGLTNSNVNSNKISKMTESFNNMQINTNGTINSNSNEMISSDAPRILIKKDERTKVTTISGYVKDNQNPEQGELMEYKVKTRSQPQPKLDFMSNNNKGLVSNQSPEDRMIKDILVNTVKSNKLTKGTIQMMENERIHADEAIECGIYVTWSSKTQMGNIVDCFRVGSNSMCICNHGFTSHEKILNKKKHSSKCQLCKCRAFTYIPVYPEEIGEYWMPYQKNFDYTKWRGKCKCKHPWDEHSAEQFLKCKKCNCFAFNSNFCCAVCDKFWQDHEMIWELEHERYMNKKPIGQDYIPFAEMPEMQEALYNK